MVYWKVFALVLWTYVLVVVLLILRDIQEHVHEIAELVGG